MTIFSRCVGVFDTVGSFGLPEELTLGSQNMTTIFGFPDKFLGEHIHYAFHALALNETRADFVSGAVSFRISEISSSCRIVPNLNKLPAEEGRNKY